MLAIHLTAPKRKHNHSFQNVLVDILISIMLTVSTEQTARDIQFVTLSNKEFC